MYVADLFENYVAEAGPQLVVLYPGRFQPFHLGHGDVFRSLQGKFGRDNVYIATSNKVEPPKSPFNFADKTVLMNAAGIPSDRIIEVTNPYKLPEPTFNPANTIFIAAVGAPDKDRLRPDCIKKDGNPGYFKTFESLDKCTTADKHGYVIIADERQKVITINNDIHHIDKTITIVKERTNEKTNSINKFSNPELEYFFTNRYNKELNSK
jgi:cytidyltransferase-like protein